jgi:hypothetical protein
LNSSTIEEIERRYAGRVLSAETEAALNENTGKSRRYKSSSQLLKTLNARLFTPASLSILPLLRLIRWAG